MEHTAAALLNHEEGSLVSLFTDESFHPPEPRTLAETGASVVLVEGLIAKLLLQVGSTSGQAIAARLGLPMGIVEPVLHSLRSRRLLVHQGQGPLNDYYYALTEEGVSRGQAAMDVCGYVGALPVLLEDYVLSVEAQAITAEAPRRRQLEEAFADISVPPELFDMLGPALNSGAGLFLYGEPGNGKTTIARRLTGCYGQKIWIPRALMDDGQIIKLFDASCHKPEERSSEGSLLERESYDRRWVKIARPTVVVGGELTMESLDLRHDPRTNVSEASLQLKSNCGCLLIDDFGRQRIEPTVLLNRWIIPLENRIDFLSLPTGKMIQVPFEQLIIFSTNLEPTDLADDAFLRRIPYKVQIGDPSRAEMHDLFRLACKQMECAYRPDEVDYLIDNHYEPTGRPLRRCHARDLLAQTRNYCAYTGQPFAVRREFLDQVVRSYFTALGNR